MDEKLKALRAARMRTGRVYRTIGTLMGYPYPSLDGAACQSVLLDLRAAVREIETLLLPNTDPDDFNESVFSVRTSIIKAGATESHQTLRVQAQSIAEATHKAAEMLDGMGLGLTSRITSVRIDRQ